MLVDDPKAKIANLALMKWSGYHKARGDTVAFTMPNPNRIYGSCIFSSSKRRFLQGLSLYRDVLGVEVKVGGYAMNGDPLPDEVEHTRPDYDLYGIDYSLGFTTRGCVRACPFCVVPKMEGALRENSPFEEFVDDRFRKIVLLDNNLLASRKAALKLQYLRGSGLKVNFNQGLDLRFMDEGMASLLADVKWWNLHFTRRSLHFAWDLMESEEQVMNGLKTLLGYVLPTYVVVYILIGYNTSHEQDVYRAHSLLKLGVAPFAMIYNDRRDDPWLRFFARWLDREYWRSVPFEDFKDGKLVTLI